MAHWCWQAGAWWKGVRRALIPISCFMRGCERFLPGCRPLALKWPAAGGMHACMHAVLGSWCLP